MSDLRNGCTECGVPTKPGEIHTWLFCLLHNQGWTRRQIISELQRHADFFRTGQLPRLRNSKRVSDGGEDRP